MPDRKCVIEKGYSFNTIEEKDGLPDNQTAITYYANKLESAVNLDENIPIFLDTNVLLRGYSVSPERRALLNKFFLDRKNQIVLTKQVQKEFIRNKKKVRKIYANLPAAQLTDASDALANLLLELRTEREETENLGNFEVVEEELLDLFSNFEHINNLSASEKKFLKQEFDFLSQPFNSQRSEEEGEISYNSFPGKGDILEKPKFPYGDYFIYHEMLKYSYESNQDVLFLTFDVAKGDWLKSSKEPHAAYIYKTFGLNEKMIFIINANKFFEDLFGTSFDSLVPIPKKVEHYIIKSKFEEELIAAFKHLEESIRKLAQKLDIDATNEDSAKYILDELNYDDSISNETYYELIGIWSIRDGLIEGDIATIRREYAPNELAEILSVVKDNTRVIDRLN
ncbi:MAG: PIN-like domain-containing protein [Saprospiraceae bacterium]